MLCIRLLLVNYMQVGRVLMVYDQMSYMHKNRTTS